MTTAEQVLNEAMKLSDRERAHVATELLRSLDPPGEDLSEAEWADAWSAELSSRIAAVERGEYADGDWRDVLERVRNSSSHEPRS